MYLFTLKRLSGIYSAAFTPGLFITIARVGVACVLLGRMLGDIGNYRQVLICAVLTWVALGMMGGRKMFPVREPVA